MLLGIVLTIFFRVPLPTTPVGLRPLWRWNERTEWPVGLSKSLSMGTPYDLAFSSQWRVFTSPPQSPSFSARAPKRWAGQAPRRCAAPGA